MDRKKELKQLYKEIPVEAGVYQIKNKVNQKIFIDSTRNLKTLNGLTVVLETGTHANKELQEDWNQLSKEDFSFDVLEVLKKKDDPYYNQKEALKELENKWLEELQPYGERGYHRKK